MLGFKYGAFGVKVEVTHMAAVRAAPSHSSSCKPHPFVQSCYKKTSIVICNLNIRWLHVWLVGTRGDSFWACGAVQQGVCPQKVSSPSAILRTSAVQVCICHLWKHCAYFRIMCGNLLRLSFYVNPPASPQTVKPSPVARHEVLQERKMHLLVFSSTQVPHSCLQNLSWQAVIREILMELFFPGRKQLCQNKGILRRHVSLA